MSKITNLCLFQAILGLLKQGYHNLLFMSSIYKKVLIDARFLGTSTGIGRYVDNLVRELEKLFEIGSPPQAQPEIRSRTASFEFIILVSKDGWEKWEPKVVVGVEALSSEPEALRALRAHKFRKKLVNTRWYTLTEQFALWRALSEEKPDLVHWPHWNVCYFWRGPFVVTIHDLILLEYPTRRASKLSTISYFIKYKLLFPLVLRRAIYKSCKIIVPSNYTEQSIIKYFPFVDQNKIEVIYEGIPHLNPPPLRGGGGRGSVVTSHKLKAKSYLLYVGNALPHKNLEFLVRVFKKIKEQPTIDSEALPTAPEAPAGTSGVTSEALRAQHMRWAQNKLKLVLVGESSYFYDRLKKYVKELGAEKDIIFTGRVSDEELAELYKNAAIYAFPSLLEGFGLPPLEAMAHGLPVVAADSSCLPEILDEAALYFDPRNEKDALDKIVRILSDESLRAKLINKGYEQVKKYDWEKMAGHIFEVYTSIIQSSTSFF